MIRFVLNGRPVQYRGEQGKPLLWVLREEFALTGSKYGCGMARCGACTVHLNGAPVRACSTPVAVAEGANVTTIEGLASPEGEALQAAWRALDVVQCGYCQSGQIMSAAALLAGNARPGDDEIDSAMRGNVCRCATYHRIRAAIHRAAETLAVEV